MRRLVTRAAPPLAVAIALAATYCATLHPGLGFDDTGELQAKAVTWELPHETGYPSWLLLAQPFRWLPWHDVAWRMNLYSALCAVAAGLGLYGSGRELALSLSAGISAGDQQTLFFDSLVGQAEAALDYAMHDGGNQVVSFGEAKLRGGVEPTGEDAK